MLEVLKNFEIKKEQLINIHGGNGDGGTTGGNGCRSCENHMDLDDYLKFKECDWWDVICHHTR